MFDVGNLKSGAYRVYPTVLPTRLGKIEPGSQDIITEFKEGERVVTYTTQKGLGTLIGLEYENITLETATILTDFYMLSQGSFNAFVLPRRIWRHRSLKFALEPILNKVGWVFNDAPTLSVVRDNRVNVQVVLRAVDSYNRRADWLTTPRYEIGEGSNPLTYQGNTDLLLVVQCDAGKLTPESSSKILSGINTIKRELEVLPEYPGHIGKIFMSPTNELSEVLIRHNPVNPERRDSLIVIHLVYKSLEFFNMENNIKPNIGNTFNLYKRIKSYYEHLKIYTIPMRIFENGEQTSDSADHQISWQNLINNNDPNTFADVGFSIRNYNVNLENFENTLENLITQLRVLLDPFYV